MTPYEAYQNAQDDLKTILVRYPESYTFGLRAYPGDLFRVSHSSSFVSNLANGTYKAMLYTQIKKGDRWIDFCKGTEAELKPEMTKVPGSSWFCPLCGQRIDDDLPCGCGNLSRVIEKESR